MNAKDKALKLCQDFAITGMTEEQTDFFSLDLSLAKQCATVCVNEILSNGGTEYHNKYWQNVKQEIEKITL